MKHVEGEDKGDILLYAISTCMWCKKTKKLLNDLNVSYAYIDIDLLDQEKKIEIEKEVKKCNPKINYPTLKINNDCITGFKEEKIKEVLEK